MCVTYVGPVIATRNAGTHTNNTYQVGLATCRTFKRRTRMSYVFVYRAEKSATTQTRCRTRHAVNVAARDCTDAWIVAAAARTDGDFAAGTATEETGAAAGSAGSSFARPLARAKRPATSCSDGQSESEERAPRPPRRAGSSEASQSSASL